MNKMNFLTNFLAALALTFLFTQVQAQALAQAQTAAAPAQSGSETIPQDQQATREQLDRLFEVMRLRQQMQATMKAIPAMIQQQLHSQMNDMYAKLPGGGKPTPEQQAKLEEIMNKYIQRAATLYSPDDMMGDITAVYQRHMSKSDVDAYIAFYSSPAGQHLLDAQPKIMQEYMPVVMGRVQKASANLTNDMTKELGDYIKSSGATSPAAK
jgi:hypothetical protein